MQFLKLISCCLVAIGMGLSFAEVRRFFFHTEAFYYEVVHDYRHGRTISLICGIAFLCAGSLIAFHAFGLGAPVLSWDFPYVSDGTESRRFLVIFSAFLIVWAIFSAASTRLFPPPLFSEAVSKLLCRIVRGTLLAIWGGALLMAFRRIGDKWLADGVGLLSAALALLAIYTGEIWTFRHIAYLPAPPVTFAGRPVPFFAFLLRSTY